MFEQDFLDIREKALAHKDSFHDKYVCPCCGIEQDAVIPEEVIQYKLLLENRNLCRSVGLLYFDDFIGNYKRDQAEGFYRFFNEINKVDNPHCLILVEGDSEETSIPLLAFRKRYILAMHSIKVYNSQSKQKLAADFKSFKKKYPNLKMICLLDSDAKKEIDEIQRIIKNSKNMYRIFTIDGGTFEDVFDIDTSISILNEMYQDGQAIEKSDFKEGKHFLENVNSFMYFKKKAEFDKVKFAQKISLKITMDKFPNVVDDVIEAAKLLMRKKKFLNENK